MKSMTTQERFARMYAHKDADRVPMHDYPWEETLDRWVAEGMPTRDYVEYFGLDRVISFTPDNSPQLPAETVSEDEDSLIYTTKWGATMRKFKHRTTTPEHLHFSVNTPDAWRKVKDRIVPTDDRIPWDWLKANYAAWRKSGCWLTGGLWFGFDITHSGMVGTETLLIAMYEDPDWVRDMIETELNCSLALLDRVWDAGYTFDEVMWWDDLGYKGTQFFSMDMYRSIVKPYHQRAIDWGHQKGLKVRMHSCGNIMPLVPEFVSMGLDGLNPLEVKAGNDPALLKQKFGSDMLFHGGINAVNWDKPDVITEEMERVIPVMKENGGYIFASDHSIPSTVSFADFCGIIDTFKRVGSY